MSGIITHAVREKIDRVACVMVQMERGEWQHADGKLHWSKDANGNRVPGVRKMEAVAHVWGNAANETVRKLFSEKGEWHAMLEERIAYHRQRLDEGYRGALAKLTDDGNALMVMSNKLYESLWWDLNDAETRSKIPFRERAHFFEVLTKMEASIKGDVTTRGQHKLQPSVVIQNINVPESVKAQMVEVIEAQVVEEEL